MEVTGNTMYQLEAGAGDSSYPEPLRGTKSGQVTFLEPLNVSFLL